MVELRLPETEVTEGDMRAPATQNSSCGYVHRTLYAAEQLSTPLTSHLRMGIAKWKVECNPAQVQVFR
jgi:hypothetical protein